MQYNNISLNILINGKPITEYPHNGQVFVEGRDRSNFEVEVRNHNPHRVEAVISVDGLSVIDGKDAGPSSSGYVIDANGSIRIPGWKLNDDQVAAFEFAGKRDSYSAAVNGGDARNTGVLGVLAYKEKQQYQPRYYAKSAFSLHSPMMAGATVNSNMRSYGISHSGLESLGGSRGISSSATLSNSTFAVGQLSTDTMYHNAVQPEAVAMSAPVEQTLGTAFGESQDFATSTITFERGDLQAMIVLFYDDARGLKARGIDLSRRARQRDTQSPVAFPGMATGCTPPAGWRG
jgi:hypothetical protein